MSTFDFLAERLAKQEITVLWSGDAENPRVVVIPANGSTFELHPDAARLLGLVLIEGAGLAMGAWGQAQADAKDDAEAENALGAEHDWRSE